MQNHIPIYSSRFDDSSDIISCLGDGYTENQLRHISYFASLMEQSNLAIADFISYLEQNAARPVIIVFFGDHQSPITPEGETEDVLTATGFFNGSDKSVFFETHRTPYLIWSNIETEEPADSFGNLVPNMLLTKTLNYFNSVRPAYFDYLLKSAVSFKGTTGGFFLDNDGNIIYNLNEEQQAEYSKRELIEYDIVNGSRYLLDTVSVK